MRSQSFLRSDSKDNGRIRSRTSFYWQTNKNPSGTRRATYTAHAHDGFRFVFFSTQTHDFGSGFYHIIAACACAFTRLGTTTNICLNYKTILCTRYIIICTSDRGKVFLKRITKTERKIKNAAHSRASRRRSLRASCAFFVFRGRTCVLLYRWRNAKILVAWH